MSCNAPPPWPPPSATAPAMFDDARFFRALREHVAPRLRTWPSVDVWLVGAGTGQQAYAVSIALCEEGLGGRVRLHATDADDAALRRAREGAYACAELPAARAAYLAGGGRASLTDYLTVRGDDDRGFFTVRAPLRRSILFAQHTPTTGASFGEMQLVVCRAAPARDDDAGARALAVMHQSLCRFGILALPRGADLAGHPFGGFYEPLLVDEGLFRRGET